VLQQVSAQAAPGRITALLGPNAVGKSTLLRCVIGALRPTAGEVLLDGQPAHRLRGRRIARRIAYVPQRSIVSAAFTVREVVRLGRYALEVDEKRIDDAMAQLELSEVAKRPYPALSVGQQQRVALARAVAQLAARGLLILDEPTAAMDLRHAHNCFSLLRRLADEGVTVLMAMHDISAAATIADDAWLLAGGPPGRLVAGGTVAEVMQPDRLEDVFGLGFEWLQRPGGTRVLLAGACSGTDPGTI
jgi:iron complex transport system ATP-binding protein